MFHVFRVVPPGFLRNFSKSQSLRRRDISSYFPCIPSHIFLYTFNIVLHTVFLHIFHILPQIFPRPIDGEGEVVICRFHVYPPRPKFSQVPSYTGTQENFKAPIFKGRKGSRIHPGSNFQGEGGSVKTWNMLKTVHDLKGLVAIFLTHKENSVCKDHHLHPPITCWVSGEDF